MIALYIVSIVVVCGLLVFYFFWSARKRKKSLDRLKLEKKENSFAINEQLEKDLEQAEKESLKEEQEIEADLQDFILEDKPKDQETETVDDHVIKNNFDFDEELDESLFEKQLDSYEQFLKEESENFEPVDDLTKEEKDDIDALMSFDFESLKGKSKEEVLQMIKDLSPSVQDFIMNDIFERKTNED